MSDWREEAVELVADMLLQAGGHVAERTDCETDRVTAPELQPRSPSSVAPLSESESTVMLGWDCELPPGKQK